MKFELWYSVWMVREITEFFVVKVYFLLPGGLKSWFTRHQTLFFFIFPFRPISRWQRPEAWRDHVPIPECSKWSVQNEKLIHIFQFCSMIRSWAREIVFNWNNLFAIFLSICSCLNPKFCAVSCQVRYDKDYILTWEKNEYFAYYAN